MKKEENTNFYQKLILMEDETYESDILDNYDLFIRRCIDFAKKKIIPLSDNQKYLDEKIKLSIDFVGGRLSKSELTEASYQFTKKTYASSSNIKEKRIKYFIYFLLDSDFLQNITPDEQQDSYISHLLSTLYEIQDNIVLYEEFYKFINEELSQTCILRVPSFLQSKLGDHIKESFHELTKFLDESPTWKAV